MALVTQLARIHNLLGRSNWIVRLAVKVRNQAAAIVSAHFSGIENPEVNGEYALIDLIAPSAVNFIDVGGNVGDWSSRFIASMSRPPVGLIADGNARCIHTLRTRFGEYSGVKVLHAAISDYLGTALFYEGVGAASALSSLTPLAMEAGCVTTRSVPVTSLDHEVEALRWNKVSMLKIDAEGHDFFVLRGARRLLSDKLVDFVQFECNSTWDAIGLNIVAATNYLTKLGYRVFQVSLDGLRAVDVSYYGAYGSANWIALHERSPDLGLRVI